MIGVFFYRIRLRPSRPGLGSRHRTKRQHAQQHHLKAASRLRGILKVTATIQCNLIKQLHRLRRQQTTETHHRFMRRPVRLNRFRHRLRHSHLLQQRQYIGKHRGKIRRVLRQTRHRSQHSGAIISRQSVQQRNHVTAIQHAQHMLDILQTHRPAAKRNRLIQQAQSVSHRTIRSMRQLRQRRRLKLNPLLRQQPTQMLSDHLNRQSLQTELQTARQHRHRQLLRIRGRQKKFDVRRRLFQRLQQRVERTGGEHMHLIHQINLVTPHRGRVLHVLQQFPGVLHLGARRGIHLQQIDEPALINRHARLTRAARRRSHALQTIQRLGENTRDGGLAHAPSAREQKRMVHPIIIQGVGQRLNHMRLAHQRGKRTGTPLSGQGLVAHATGTTTGRRERKRRQRPLPAIRVAIPPVHPGARNHRYGCSLPGLTRFTAYRRERPTGSP